MRNENRLRESYQKQKEIFENAKAKKINNLLTRKKEILNKIDALEKQLTLTELQIREVDERSFRTFEDYLSHAKHQAAESQKNSIN